MVESNKFRALEEHNRRLDEEAQEIHQELHDLKADLHKQGEEQNIKIDQLSKQIEIVITNLQSLEANKDHARERRENSNSNGINMQQRSCNHGKVYGQQEKLEMRIHCESTKN